MNEHFTYIHIPRTGGSFFTKKLREHNIKNVKLLDHASSRRFLRDNISKNIIFSFRDPFIHKISCMKNFNYNSRVIDYFNKTNKFKYSKDEYFFEPYHYFKTIDEWLDNLLNTDKEHHKIAYDFWNKIINFDSHMLIWDYESFFKDIDHIKNQNKVYAINLDNIENDIARTFKEIANKDIIINNTTSETNYDYSYYKDKYEEKYKKLFPKEYELYEYFMTICKNNYTD